jgi:hypothetical protein
MKELPIACELTPAELGVRREELLAGLLALTQERITITNGLRWRFAPTAEFLTAAVQMIDAERRCCRFLKFVLTVEPDAGDMWLEITGPEGTAEFLATLVGTPDDVS